MAAAIKKYNPGFLTDSEIISSFCVRTGEFDSIMESVRECTGNSNTHTIVIGPRGSGKTHLLLRVAAEVRQEARLAGFFPVVFAEESYEVSTIGEFWLECLGRLAEQAPEGERANLRLSYDDIRTTANDRELADRCLGLILDFADHHGERVLLLVENLNMLFSDLVDPDAGWRLRHTLQTEPRIILLGSATSRFEEIDSPDHALYDLFRVVTLRPLDTGECTGLWQVVSGKPSPEGAIRPLEILTGGNPRLLAIIARFGAGRTFLELMDDLLDLVDDHTEYFKSHLESLPAQERRVYLALARLWKPATSREISAQARLDINICSSLLKRLEGRGVVALEGGTARRRQYYLTERLYNIYYLLRRDGGSNRVVDALVDFMTCFYSPAEVWDLTKPFLDRADDFGGMSQRATAYFATAMSDEALRLEGLGQVDEALEVYDDILRRLDSDDGLEADLMVTYLLIKKATLFLKDDRGTETIAACDDLVNRLATHEDSLIHALVVSSDVIKGLALLKNNQIAEAVSAFDKVVMQFEPDAPSDVASFVLMAIVVKTTLGEAAINEKEVSILLKCQEQEDELKGGVIEALTKFGASAGAKRTLELIQGSEAAPLLLPLVTALQQELGQETQVAKEVDEVAGDVRGELARQAIGDAQGWLCRNCRKDISGKGEAQLDHIVPVSNGGTNEFENLQLLCPRCNISKGRKVPRQRLNASKEREVI